MGDHNAIVGAASTTYSGGSAAPAPADLACGAWARQEGVDPFGTALSFDAYLLIEWPRPWPSDILREPRLAPLAAMVGSDVRVNALVPTSPDLTSRRVILYRRRSDDDGWFRSFERSEAVVPHDALVATAVVMIQAGDAAPVAASMLTDVLVCTHGSRDVCCGSRGTRLLREATVELVGPGPGPARLWQSSHIGSHHFAPNVMVLPTGTIWGMMDVQLLSHVLERRGRIDDVLTRYRGCVGLPTPGLQAVERAAFQMVGWSWLDYERRGSTVDGDLVRLEARSPDGETLAWEASVRPGRRMAIPACRPRTPPPGEFATEVVVSDLRRIA